MLETLEAKIIENQKNLKAVQEKIRNLMELERSLKKKIMNQKTHYFNLKEQDNASKSPKSSVEAFKDSETFNKKPLA